MPSFSHEGLVRLFRNRPDLAPELLRDSLQVPLPDYAEARVEDGDLTHLQPTQFTADLVVLLRHGKPVLAIVVEVQLAVDPRKRFVWPVYVATSRARYECDACVLVVTPRRDVAAWARQPITLGPAAHLIPHVVGPEAVPVVRDVDQARRDPELAVLSSMTHGNDPVVGTHVVLAALGAASGLETERELLYSDLVMASLNDAMRAALEDIMASGQYEYQSDFAKKHRAEGKAEGEAKGKAELLLRQLSLRFGPLSSLNQVRVRDASLEELDRWADLVLTAKSLDDFNL